MEFQRQLAANRLESKEDGPPVMADPSEIKQQINDVLFRYMPPKTTLDELEDFALAVFGTIVTAWSQHAEDGRIK